MIARKNCASAKCPHCHIEAHISFQVKDLNMRTTDEAFTYYRCTACELIFLWPIPSDLGKYYPPEYYTIPPSIEQLASMAQGERYKIELVQRFVGAGRLLEIGPAYGSFAYLAKQAGFQVEVVETDKRCCQFLTETVGVRAINSEDIPTSLMGTEPYDVIVLWHVIEHLQDPWTTLQKVREKLRPSGILIIATPNPSALQFRVFGRFWTHLDAPRHTILIPVSFLLKQIEKQGLKTVLLTTTDRGSLGWNTFGWRMSLRNLVISRKAKRILSVVGSLVISSFFSPIERMDWHGSAYTAIFRKSL